MDNEEIALKKKLDQTEDIDERRELRKQIREIRNRKFDEEIKKITSGEITHSTLTNDISNRKPVKKIESNEECDSDHYGLLAYTTEQSLQDLLNDTSFTETDKRRKIRTRMREIRNAECDNEASKNRTSGDTNVKISSQEVARKPSPKPAMELSPEPTMESSPEPMRESSPEPARESSPEHVRESSPEPERESSPEPMREFSPEPVREFSPEPVRESSPEPMRELSPETVRDSSPQPVRDSSPEPDRESSPEPDRESSPEPNRELSPESPDEAESDEELDIDSGDDFTDSLKHRQDTHVPLMLERALPKGGEQVDFRSSLKRKSESPVLNLERKPVASEQVDFRNTLGRKVDVQIKKEDGLCEQVDFRTALKRNIERPNFDKTPIESVQVDFRTALSNKVQTRTLEDKNIEAEQKDFRAVLGKVPLSPKTGRRSKSVDIQGPIDRPESPEEGIVEENGYVKNDKCEFRYVPSPDLISEGINDVSSEAVSQPINIKRDSPKPSKIELTRKSSKKAPPPVPVKKKVAIPKTEPTENVNDHFAPTKETSISQPSHESLEAGIDDDKVSSPQVESGCTPESIGKNDSFSSIQHSESNEKVDIIKSEFTEGDHVAETSKCEKKIPEELPKGESDEEILGKPRNKQSARTSRAERTQRRLAKEELDSKKLEESKFVDSEKENAITGEKNKEVSTPSMTTKDDNTSKPSEEKPTRRSRKEDVTNESRSERNTRRTRRLAALGDNQTDEGKKEINGKDDGLLKHGGTMPDSTVNGISENKQSSVVACLKYENDKEEEKTEKPQLNGARKIETETHTVLEGNGHACDKEKDLRKDGTHTPRKNLEEEKVEVHVNVLAEINETQEEPKKNPTECQLNKIPRTTTPLGVRAAEREAEKQKREREREERAAARAKEREEATRKRKEQKEALEKKMADTKKQRALRMESSAAAKRNAFKEKLESNSIPGSGPKSNVTPVNSNITKLLGWVKNRIKDYEGVTVENFGDSWTNGLAFAALIHSFCPDNIPIKELGKTTKRRNFELAFATAKEEGVMDLLDVEDMVNMRSPDPKSIITYLHSVYQVFSTQTT